MKSLLSRCLLTAALITLNFSGFSLAQDQAIDENSHPHLQQQYCFDCHQCENPTKSAPCLKSCPYSHVTGQSANMPEGKIPGLVKISQLSKLYGPVLFKHQIHAEMSALYGGCIQCHHYSEGDNYPRCQQCHPAIKASINTKQPGLKGAYHRQCMDCHIEWAGDNGCDFCHLPLQETDGKSVPTQSPGVEIVSAIVINTSYRDAPIVNFHHEEHSQNFGLSCSDCHTGSNCTVCHAGKHVTTTVSNRTESCFTCHADDNCRLCHSTQILDKSYHYSGSNWALNASHTALSCAACHGPPKAFAGPTPTCTSCHANWSTDNFNHVVTGFVLSSEHEDTECDVCHINEKYAAAPRCNDCHDDDVTYPDMEPGERVSKK